METVVIKFIDIHKNKRNISIPIQVEEIDSYEGGIRTIYFMKMIPDERVHITPAEMHEGIINTILRGK